MPDQTDLNPDQFREIIGQARSLLGGPGPGDAERVVRAWIARIDALLSAQLAEVMHHPDFQRLEAAWRGLHYLVHQPEGHDGLKIKVFNVAKRELLKDAEHAVESHNTVLFRNAYTEPYETPCGVPFGLLVGDFEFSAGPEDVGLLRMIAAVAAAAHAPFVAAASPRMFGWERFTALAAPRDVSAPFQEAKYARWRAFRDSEGSRYVALTLPRVLGRLPYGEGFRQLEAFNFEEFIGGRDHDRRLWMSAAWAYAANVADAFSKHGWFARLRGAEGGGKVVGLPVHAFPTDGGPADRRLCEVAIDDRQEFHLSTLGFLPLIDCKNKDFAVFFGAQSCQKPKTYNDDGANASAQLLAKLTYLLCVSRFGQHLMLLARDLHSVEGINVWENRLKHWIWNYVVQSPDMLSDEGRAKVPLSNRAESMTVEVRAVRGKPGRFEIVAWLEPAFQLEDWTAPMRMVCEIPLRPDYRPAPVSPGWLRWKDATVARMARAIRESGRFADLPILADALEEAGCADERVLGHCRDDWAGHAAGCWVLDALLGQG
jgi:type VI secretion system protein ImpC